MLKTLFRIGINTAIGAVLIYFWFKLVNINEIIHALESFNPLILIPAFLLMVLSSVCRALRFKVLLSEEIQVPLFRIINLTFLSQLLSFTIPIRLGEVSKGVYLSSEYGLHFGKAVIWVFLDRFLDFWAVLAIALLLLVLIPTNLPSGLVASLFIIVSLSSVLLIAAVLRPEIFKLLVGYLSQVFFIKSFKDKFKKFGFFMIECFELLKGEGKRNFLIAGLTVLGILLEGASWFTVLMVFIPELNFFKVWLGSMLNSLTFIIPAAPGYVGSAEAAGLAVFSFGLGFDKTLVSAATIIIHALSLLFILSSGIYGLYALKFNLGLVWKKVLRKE